LRRVGESGDFGVGPGRGGFKHSQGDTSQFQRTLLPQMLKKPIKQGCIHVFRVSDHPIYGCHAHTERLRDLPDRMPHLACRQRIGDVYGADFRPPAPLDGHTGAPFVFRWGTTASGTKA
jgi:hypothetical protein